ncbi:MAG: hypothetical protein ABIN05_07960 [candidate division WOR-3 bacterium]
MNEEIFIPESQGGIAFPEISRTERFLDLLNKTFLIHDFVLRQSKKFSGKEMAIIKCSDLEKKEEFVTFTTSEVIIKTLKENEQKFKEGKKMKVTLIRPKGKNYLAFM